jgi:hypothetical protein
MSALFLLLALPQAAAAAPEPQYEEVVVTATARRVALVFDKAPDGRLINCRVFKSSGVDRIDAKACTSLPDCVTSTKGQQYCGGEGKMALMAVEPKTKPEQPNFGLGVTLTPEAPKNPAVGPAVTATAEEDPNRLSKLPPPPKDQSTEPSIRFGGMKPEEPK